MSGHNNNMSKHNMSLDLRSVFGREGSDDSIGQATSGSPSDQQRRYQQQQQQQHNRQRPARTRSSINRRSSAHSIPSLGLISEIDDSLSEMYDSSSSMTMSQSTMTMTTPSHATKQQQRSSTHSLGSEASMSLGSLLASLPIPGAARHQQQKQQQQQQQEGDHEQHDLGGPPRIPSSVHDAQETMDDRMSAVRSKIAKLNAQHSEDRRRHQFDLEILKREQADLQERLRVAIEDIEDKRSIAEYAGFITEKTPAKAIDSTYVLRLQSQLCKALHKYGVLTNQVDLAKQQADDSIKGNISLHFEQESMNDLIEMEGRLATMKARHGAEMSRKEHEVERLTELLEQMHRERQAASSSSVEDAKSLHSVNDTVTVADTAITADSTSHLGEQPVDPDHADLLEELEAKDSLIKLLQEKLEHHERRNMKNSSLVHTNTPLSNQYKYVTRFIC